MTTITIGGVTLDRARISHATYIDLIHAETRVTYYREMLDRVRAAESRAYVESKLEHARTEMERIQASALIEERVSMGKARREATL